MGGKIMKVPCQNHEISDATKKPPTIQETVDRLQALQEILQVIRSSLRFRSACSSAWAGSKRWTPSFGQVFVTVLSS